MRKFLRNTRSSFVGETFLFLVSPVIAVFSWRFWNLFCIISSNRNKKWTSIPNLLFLDDPLPSLDACCYHLASMLFWFSLTSLSCIPGCTVAHLEIVSFLNPSEGQQLGNFPGMWMPGFSSLRKIQLSHCWASALITQLLCRNCTFPVLCNEIGANISFSSHELSVKGKYSEKAYWINPLRDAGRIWGPVCLNLDCNRAEDEVPGSLPRLEGRSVVLTTRAVTAGTCRTIMIGWVMETSRSLDDLNLDYSQVLKQNFGSRCLLSRVCNINYNTQQSVVKYLNKLWESRPECSGCWQGSRLGSRMCGQGDFADAVEATFSEQVRAQSLRGTACHDSGLSAGRTKHKDCHNWRMDVQEAEKRWAGAQVMFESHVITFLIIQVITSIYGNFWVLLPRSLKHMLIIQLGWFKNRGRRQETSRDPWEGMF